MWRCWRADGQPAADDEPAAFAAAGKLPQPDYAADGLRDFNDLGRWYSGCQDSNGYRYFLASCNGRQAADTHAGGVVHTQRPDGRWTSFRIYPAKTPRHEMRFEALRWTVHRHIVAPEQKLERNLLATLGEFVLPDPVAEAHGHAVEPIPPGADQLRRQQWQDHTDQPRNGPVYFLRFDGRGPRFERSSVGWGVYDMVFRAWPQPDGRIYLANRFGLWVHWPAGLQKHHVDEQIADLFELDETKQALAAETLTSMGRLAIPALEDAIGQASAESTRRRLADLVAAAGKVARGEEDAVPVVAGRWRFFKAYPQATMPDGRFAFSCERAVDVRANRVVNDCLVVFTPPGVDQDAAGESFEVRPIDRAQWNQAGFADKRANEPPVHSMDATVVDLGGGMWVPGGFRFVPGGRIARVVPPGLNVRLPHAVDPDGRVYFHSDAPNSVALFALRPDAPAPGAGAKELFVERPREGAEVTGENVRGVFRQPDLPPPWNAWAVQERDGAADVLLRLDGPKPTPLDLPPAIRTVRAVVPVDGGCVVSGPANAGYWDGNRWEVARDVATLVQLRGAELAARVPARVFAADTSAFKFNYLYEHQLLLASDGRGGLWVAEDAPTVPPPGAPPPRRGPRTRGRSLWHWDGRRLTDLWGLLPLKPERGEDGAVMTAEQGRALIVQVESDLTLRPGGYWAVWRVTDGDLKQPRRVPQTANQPGLVPTLLAALGPNTVFSRGLWADREGWVWSPIFSKTGEQWMRTRDNMIGPTALVRFAWPGAIAQGKQGGAWCVTGKMGDAPAVWADVGETGDEPKHYPRMTWVGAQLPGMGAAAQIAVAPDDKVYVLHEGGCSLVRLRRLAEGEKPKLPTRTTVRPPRPPATQPGATQPATQPAATRPAAPGADTAVTLPWEIEEVARRRWDGPRNDFGRTAFDDTGVWFLPADGPLIRAPLPRE